MTRPGRMLSGCAGRIMRLNTALEKRAIGALVVTNGRNVSYLSGFRGSDALLFITPGQRYLITDFRYIEEAQAEVRGFRIVQVKRTTYETIATLAKRHRVRRLGFESMNLPYGVARKLGRTLGRRTRAVPLPGMVETLRQVKDAAEVERVRHAARLTSALCRDFLKTVKEGETERSLAARLGAMCLRRGVAPAFEPIVAVNANAAKPHAIPSGTAVKKPGLLLIDVGVKAGGYCADMTRTVLFGRVRPLFRKLYAIVQAAQAAAIERISPGVRAAAVDAAAREVIARNGYGRYFGHALGHGVGMEVHEAPSVSRRSGARLGEGMVVTVEPAIYIPGVCGVRIEDTVLVTGSGGEVITGGETR